MSIVGPPPTATISTSTSPVAEVADAQPVELEAEDRVRTARRARTPIGRTSECASPTSPRGIALACAMIDVMSDIERRRGGRMTRRHREQRAYRLVLATGAFGVIAAACLVLTIAGVISGGWWVVSAIIAAICFIALRGTLRGR
jgi:hypothetical protein